MSPEDAAMVPDGGSSAGIFRRDGEIHTPYVTQNGEDRRSRSPSANLAARLRSALSSAAQNKEPVKKETGQRSALLSWGPQVRVLSGAFLAVSR